MYVACRILRAIYLYVGTAKHIRYAT